MDDKLLKFAYGMAFRDATLRKAFQKSGDENDDIFRDRKNQIKESVYIFVEEYINMIFNDDNPDPLDTIKTICQNCFDQEFTFGNAQKLVNMTAKYMYLTTYQDEYKRKMFSGCHCPMDGIMIKIVGNKTKEYLSKKLSYKNTSWSTLMMHNDEVPKEYMDFQNDVKKLCSDGEIPLDIDYLYYEL